MKNILLIICMILLVPLIAINAIATGLDDYYSILIIKPVKYCMCDDDCTGNQGCLSEDSGWILTLTTKENEYLEDAKDIIYNGVCAQLYFQTHETPYSMTSDCSFQYEPELVNLTQSEQQEDTTNTTESNQTETQTTGENDTQEETEQETGEVETEEIEQNENLITTKATEEKEENAQKQKKEEQQIGEDETMVPTIYIVTATMVIMGFFILIGWLSYLLYRK